MCPSLSDDTWKWFRKRVFSLFEFGLGRLGWQKSARVDTDIATLPTRRQLLPFAALQVRRPSHYLKWVRIFSTSFLWKTVRHKKIKKKWYVCSVSDNCGFIWTHSCGCTFLAMPTSATNCWFMFNFGRIRQKSCIKTCTRNYPPLCCW